MRPRTNEQREERSEPEGQWVNGRWHTGMCRCGDCDPDFVNDTAREFGLVRFGHDWI